MAIKLIRILTEIQLQAINRFVHQLQYVSLKVVSRAALRRIILLIKKFVAIFMSEQTYRALPIIFNMCGMKGK